MRAGEGGGTAIIPIPIVGFAGEKEEDDDDDDDDEELEGGTTPDAAAAEEEEEEEEEEELPVLDGTATPPPIPIPPITPVAWL